MKENGGRYEKKKSLDYINNIIVKKLIFTCLLIFTCTIAQAGKIITDSITSNSLGATVKYNVYLPAHYSEKHHYPVVYLLHGLSDDYTAWRDRGQLKIVADELIETGEACEMVIVMPNAGGSDIHKIWNGYFNMPGWPYEDFFFYEFIPAVESKYNAGGSKGQRAVMGLSMGGGGSTVYAQRHPDKFIACYAMSAWLEGNVRNEKNIDDKLYWTEKSVRDHSALEFVRQANEATLRELRSVKWFFDCGDDDFLLDLTTELHRLMRQRRVKDELRVRNGAHNWEYWHTALRTALPFASRNFRD